MGSFTDRGGTGRRGELESKRIPSFRIISLTLKSLLRPWYIPEIRRYSWKWDSLTPKVSLNCTRLIQNCYRDTNYFTNVPVPVLIRLGSFMPVPGPLYYHRTWSEHLRSHPYPGTPTSDHGRLKWKTPGRSSWERRRVRVIPEWRSRHGGSEGEVDYGLLSPSSPVSLIIL